MANILFISIYDINADGLRLLSSILKENNHSASILFLKRFLLQNYKPKPDDWTGIGENGKAFGYARNSDITEKEKKLFINLIREINPDLIGLNVNSSLKRTAIDVSNIIKKNFSIPLIWGGYEPTVNTEEALNYCDYVLRGESEKSILEIAENIDKKLSLNKINNLAFMRGKKLVQNPLNSLINNLDILSCKDVDSKDKFLIDNNEIVRNFSELSFNEGYYISTSRGCLFQCSYCGESYSKKLYSSEKTLRRKSPEKVIDEIKYVLENHDLKSIHFGDEIFSYDKKWINKFSKLYKKELGIPFACNVFPYKETLDYLPVLKNTGLNYICLGLQSGSERINREIFNRYYNQKEFLQVARKSHKLKINFYVDVITYNPFETEQDLKKTLDVLKELPKPFNLCVNKLFSIPGTKINLLLKNKKYKLSKKQERLSNYYARLFWLTNESKYNVYIINLIQAMRIFKYVPWLINPAVIKYPHRLFDKIRKKMEIEQYIQNSCLKIHVKPNSTKTEIKSYDETKGLLVDVAAPADKNKANIEIVKFFSKKLKKKVAIKKGLTSRDKVLLIS